MSAYELFETFSCVSNMVAVNFLSCSHCFEVGSCEMTGSLKMRGPHPQQQVNWVY
jgi:hypothetical protein